ncbi:MAG: hypothetical protein HY247_07895 [archaeon]|nr:MAG: hypothetical protein HY247_07895 [archaeon]
MSGPEGGYESRTVADVQASTRFLLESFKAKIAALKECGPEIQGILRFGVDPSAARTTAQRFFGSDSVRYMAVDGTEDVDQHLDLIVFYVGAFAYTGELKFAPEGVLAGEPIPEDESLSVSAAIPLSEEDAAQVFGQRRESGVEVDPRRLPGSIMHLAEYYLAYRAMTAAVGARVVLLDRSLAGDLAHLVWSTKDLVSSRLCILEGVKTKWGTVTNFDLELVRLLLPEKSLQAPSPRSHLLKLAAVQVLMGGEEMSAEELVSRLGAKPGRAKGLEEDLRRYEEVYGVAHETSGRFLLEPGVKDHWERVLEATLTVCEHVFRPEGGHPLRFKGGRSEVWVTADDLDYMVLVLCSAVARLAWARKILPIGLVKDSNAFELIKAGVPILEAAGLYKTKRKFPNFNSDKMLLQTNSVVNAEEVPTPWHTVEIDAAFRTMAPVPDGPVPPGAARVNGAYRNLIYPERLFVKSYIQLWASEKSPEVRSHVFAFDRPAFAEFDHWDEVLIVNRDGPVDEEIRPILHFNRGSEMTNMAMSILFEMGREVIPEALGHNYPLFLADKKAKTVLAEAKKAYLGAVEVELAKSDLDQQVLFSRRFRDYRSMVEGQRKV